MKLSILRPFLIAGMLMLCITLAGAENWPGWRGPRGDGSSLDHFAPATLTAAGIAWKTELPGKGYASPIVWGDRVFTVTCLDATQERVLLCLDRTGGKLLWQQTVLKAPLEKINKENSYASCTPLTDGKRVFVTFLDGKDIVVAAHDLKTGKQLWLVRPGTYECGHGYAKQMALFKDTLIINGDDYGDAFMVALDRTDGHKVWRTAYGTKGMSFGAPIIREMAGRTQMVHGGGGCINSLDPADGSLLWTVDGPSAEFCSTPVYSAKTGLVYITSSYPARHLLAIRPDGKGNVTKTHIAWRDDQGPPYVPCMIVEGDYLMTINMPGVMHCFDAASGKILWTDKVGKHYASPVSINGLVYFVDVKGGISVIKPGPKLERVAQMKLGEEVFASPAVSDGQIFIRGFKHLYCIGKHANPAK